MAKIGFSTGSIAKADYRKALEVLNNIKDVDSVELSALREEEVEVLVNDLSNMDLSKYSYVSFHAPSKLDCLNESSLITLLEKVIELEYNVIVHPDIVSNFDIWKSFGELLCIENMDKRKHTGRTLQELSSIFDKLPNASLCFDIAHAYQVDSSMIEATDILKSYGSKIKQIHISEINSESKHETLSMAAVLSYHQVSEMISKEIPIIIESLLEVNEIENEMKMSQIALSRLNYGNNDNRYKEIQEFLLRYK